MSYKHHSNPQQRAQKIAETHQMLEEIKMATESQNTRLLKIQKEERVAEQEYLVKKNDMEKTLKELSQRAKVFNEEQKKMTDDLEHKKETLIFKNDIRKKQEEDKCNRDRASNKEKLETIQKLRAQKELYENKLESIKQKLQTYGKYKDFLQEIQQKSVEFELQKNDKFVADQNIMQIIDRYNGLMKNQNDFTATREAIEKQKELQVKQINHLNKLIESEQYTFTSQNSELQEKISQLTKENRKLETEYEAKIGLNNNRLAEYGQIIMAINNLYVVSKEFDNADKPKNDQHSKIDQLTKMDNETTETLVHKLTFIKDKFVYLQDLSDLQKEFEKERLEQKKN